MEERRAGRIGDTEGTEERKEYKTRRFDKRLHEELTASVQPVFILRGFILGLLLAGRLSGLRDETTLGMSRLSRGSC